MKKYLLAMIIAAAVFSENGHALCFSGDCENGFGTFKNDEGGVYEGYFKYGLPHGKGTYTAPSGSKDIIKYSGDHKFGVREGQGTMWFSNGSKYSGGLKGDHMHGRGMMIHSDGTKYDGQWKDGSMHGKGKLYGPDGKIKQQGIWSDGVFTGAGGKLKHDM